MVVDIDRRQRGPDAGGDRQRADERDTWRSCSPIRSCRSSTIEGSWAGLAPTAATSRTRSPRARSGGAVVDRRIESSASVGLPLIVPSWS